MKENEAPEKIYITPHFERRWFTKEIDDVSVEYIRTDAFIEKACDNIKNLLSGYIIRNFHFGDSYDMDKLIEDFRKYMEGE